LGTDGENFWWDMVIRGGVDGVCGYARHESLGDEIGGLHVITEKSEVGNWGVLSSSLFVVLSRNRVDERYARGA
jgi:hypothetical protein